MGSKQHTGKFDCYHKALPDEPRFTLLARDPDFARLIREWANRREADVKCGLRPVSDMEMVRDAMRCAAEGEDWRRENNGAWRTGRVEG